MGWLGFCWWVDGSMDEDGLREGGREGVDIGEKGNVNG